MKDDFKLPRYYAVKITKESHELLNNWRTHSGALNDVYDGYCLSMYDKAKGYWTHKLNGNYAKYKIITLEQFKVYVLGFPLNPKENVNYLIPLLKKLNIK